MGAFDDCARAGDLPGEAEVRGVSGAEVLSVWAEECLRRARANPGRPGSRCSRRSVPACWCGLCGQIVQIIDQHPQPPMIPLVEVEDQAVQMIQRRFVALGGEGAADAELAVDVDVGELLVDLGELLRRWACGAGG